jgi:SPX domain protein involved in polyphosphate accumulation
MAPRLTTWYRRACLTGEGGRVRITLDEHLTFCRPQTLGTVGALVRPRGDEVIATGPARILEIKLWGDMPDWLAHAVDGISPAPKFSKFRTGMMAMAQKLGSPPLESAHATERTSALFALCSEPAR